MRERLNTAASILALAAVYFVAGKFGLSLAFVNASASAVWPLTGIALGALLLWGNKLWPGVFLGAFLVNITTQGSPATALGIATGNTLEALLAVWLVRQFANGVKAFEHARTILKFVGLAGILSTSVSATCGVMSLCLGGLAKWEEYPAVWFTWWLGDMTSNLIIAPLLIIWMTRGVLQLKPKQALEAAGLVLSLIVISGIVFLGAKPFARANYSLEYLAIPPLLWAAFRFDQRGAILSAFVTSALSLWGTSRGFGPFAAAGPNESLLLLQTFTSTITITALVLAAVVSERRKAEQSLYVQDAIIRVLAESPTLVEATPKILQTLCETGEWDFGAIWNVNRTANELSCVEVWHVPSRPVPAFEAVTRQRTFRPGIGLPGRVWSSRKPAWVPDVTKDDNFPRAPFAVQDGLHAAFCFPIEMGNDIVGVIECFSHHVREPDKNFLQMLAAIGSQVGHLIERKRAEEALRAKEAQLRLVTDTTPVLLAQCNRDLRYTFANRACVEFLGLTRELVVGKRIPEVLGAEAYETIRPYVETVLQGQPVEFELEVPYQRIGPRSMYVVYKPDHDEAGHVRGWVASISDVTERKKAEESRRRIEALKGAILDSALDGIISIDQQGKVIEFNPAAERTFGYTREESLGRPMAELIVPPRLREQHYRGLARYLATGEGPLLGKRIEIMALRADGSEIPVELSIQVIQHGNDTIFTANLRDITERKKTESALEEARAKLKAHADGLEITVAERTQELRETIAELESFSYSISHDMRGPLRAMQGYASVLQQELAGRIGDEGREYLARIVAASSRLTSLVQDILSYSQVSRTKLQLQPIDLHALLLEVIQRNPNLCPPQAEIRIEGPLPMVLAHEAALTQVCSNLLGNAVKFVHPGTKPRIRIWPEADNSQARIWIADNGIGIDPKNHERIFQMFERVNSPKDYDGTGIGLAIVRKAIERMGGKLGVKSELGNGSEFWFELRQTFSV